MKPSMGLSSLPQLRTGSRSPGWLMVLLAGMLAALLANSSWADERKLTIIHTNDLHGHLQGSDVHAGAARLAALVREARRDNPAVLVLDAGDSISGTPVSTLFKGVPIFEVMNAVGYNAAALGNHEFDHGFRQIDAFKDKALFPLLSANSRTADDERIADEDTLLMQVNGIRVALIGLITETTPNLITPIGNEGLKFQDPATTLARHVARLDPLADLVIVLSHVGHEEEKRLAAAVDNIDIIIGGHSHTKVEPPVKINDTYVVQAAYYGSHIGYLDVTVDTDLDRMTGFAGRLIPAADLPAPDPKVAQLVAEWEQQVASLVDVVIGESDRDYERMELQPLLESMIARRVGADFGYYNKGGIRAGIRKGPITKRHLWSLAPFGNGLVTVTALGKDIRRMMTFESEAHARNAQVHPRLAELQDDQLYRVATNTFVVQQALRLAAEAGDPAPDKTYVVEESGMLVRDVLIEHIAEFGLAEAP